MDRTYTIREVEKRDLPELVSIEQQRWAREGTEILTYDILNNWLETKSPYFLLAERDGVIEGFYYAILVDFSLNNIEEHTAPHMQTGHGWTVHTHNPKANSLYTVNVVQKAPLAGVALNNDIHARIKNNKVLYFIGAPRLVNLDHYLSMVERQHDGNLPYRMDDIALWYAHESMKLLGKNNTWSECTPQPRLSLPPLRRPDALLKFTLQNIEASLLRIVPNLMRDPKSRGYGAFLASKCANT